MKARQRREHFIRQHLEQAIDYVMSLYSSMSATIYNPLLATHINWKNCHILVNKS